MNIFRDKKLVVAPLEGAGFPLLCVKTGAPVDSKEFQLKLKVIKPAGSNHGAKIAGTMLGEQIGGSVVEGVSILANREKFTCSVGLKRMPSKRTPLWKALGIGSLCRYVLLTILTLVMEDQGKINWATGEGVFVVALTVAALLAGIIFLGLCVFTVFRPEKCDGQYVWLKGAGSKFLEALPDFNSAQFEPTGSEP